MYGQYLKIEDCKNGKGVFTTVVIPSNSMIVEMSGPIILDRNLPIDSTNYLQIGPNSFMGASGGVVPDYLNHNCDPNCKIHIVGNRVFLYSLYVIPINSELNFDYATTSTDNLESWQMNCTCNSNKCRKIVSGATYLGTELFNLYKNKGMLPLYITHPGLIQKS